ncbi:MAG: hypothetical protein JO257_02220 [Deltaproteobacteria bacterium]|nr:hypothetical protein [Deltaproteobacteria bacterium]
MGYGRIGYHVATPPAGVVVVRTGDTTHCREEQAGATIGEVEIVPFKAALVIDRDGILEEKARHAVVDEVAAGAHVLEPAPVELGGLSGWRIDAEVRRGTSPLRYVHVFALAPDDLGIDGGVLVTVRSASPEWPAADQIVHSLKIFAAGRKIANR